MLLIRDATICAMVVSLFCSLIAIVYSLTAKAHQSFIPFPFVVSLLRVMRTSLDYELASISAENIIIITMFRTLPERS